MQKRGKPWNIDSYVSIPNIEKFGRDSIEMNYADCAKASATEQKFPKNNELQELKRLKLSNMAISEKTT